MGFGANPHRGIYLYEAGQLSLVADVLTPVPGSSATFDVCTRVDVDRTGVVFHALRSGDLRPGIYRYTESTGVTVVADPTTPVPDFPALLSGFAPFVATSNGTVSFAASYFDGTATRRAVFLWRNGAIERLIDDSTVVALAGERFVTFSGMELAGDGLGLRATSDETEGIYHVPLAAPYAVTRVAGLGDIINGRQVVSLRWGFDGISFGLHLDSTNDPTLPGARGMYVASGIGTQQVPALGSAGRGLFSLLLLAAATRMIAAGRA